MTDHLDKKRRSWNMSLIRSKHSKPEVLLRSLLHRSGLRFRIENKGLPGNPDIYLPKYNAVVLVHGCFWHRHEGCPKSTVPSTNRSYWLDKFKRNKQRDVQVERKLKEIGLKVLVCWECELTKDPYGVLGSVYGSIGLASYRIQEGCMSRQSALKAAEKRSKYLISRSY